MSFITSLSRRSRRVAPHKPSDALDSAPVDFNPVAHPIISKHFFGIEPLRQSTLVPVDVIADLRRQRHVQQVYQLGDRIFAELLAEIGAERGITTIIDQKLERYAELEPEALEVAGGDRFWPVPLREVER